MFFRGRCEGEGVREVGGFVLFADDSGFWDKDWGGIVKLQTLHRALSDRILAFKDPEKEPWDESPTR